MTNRTTGPGGMSAWRDARSYEQLAGIDEAGLMWEWLRRDPDYVAWYAKASTATRGAGNDAANDPRPWGLHFR